LRARVNCADFSRGFRVQLATVSFVNEGSLASAAFPLAWTSHRNDEVGTTATGAVRDCGHLRLSLCYSLSILWHIVLCIPRFATIEAWKTKQVTTSLPACPRRSPIAALVLSEKKLGGCSSPASMKSSPPDLQRFL